MEQTNERLTQRGYLSSEVATKDLEGGKKIANFAINTAKKGEEANYVYVQAWDENADKVKNLKKGELVEVTGKFNTYKENTNFVINDVKKVDLTETLSFKGNLTKDAATKEVGDDKKKITNFTIAHKDGDDKTLFLKCNAWHESLKKYNSPADLLKQGDFIEVKGYYSKEYAAYDNVPEDKKHLLKELKTNENAKVELKPYEVMTKDLVVTELSVISHQLKRSATPEQKDNHLVEAVTSGNYKEVEIALKSGADKNAIKPEHLGKLSEKQKKAVTDVISKFDINAEKKNNGMKLS